METVQSRDGTTIAYHRSGSGPALVLVHGAIVDHRCWARVVPLLEPHFTVYALDRRGRGASGDTPPYAVEREVDDVLALLASIGEPAYLLGHSSGAILALEAALRAPRLRRLALYEPPLIVEGQRLRPPADLADRLQALVTSGEHEAALRLFLREGPGNTEIEINRMAASRQWSSQVARANTTPYDARVAHGYAADAHRLQALQQPVLLLVGSASPGWLRRGTEALASALPASRLAVLPGQKHFAMYAAPELFARELITLFAVSERPSITCHQ